MRTIVLGVLLAGCGTDHFEACECEGADLLGDEPIPSGIAPDDVPGQTCSDDGGFSVYVDHKNDESGTVLAEGACCDGDDCSCSCVVAEKG